MKNILSTKTVAKWLVIAFILNYMPQFVLSEEPPAGPGAAAQEQPQKPGFTFAECYRLALKQSETVAISSEVIKEAEARFLQAFGTILPHVTFESDQTNFDPRGDSSSFPGNRSFERKFIFKQALFSGFKEFAAMSGSKHEYKQRVYEKKRAEQLLLVDVSGAFYLLAEQMENLNTLLMIKNTLIDRIGELKQRQDLGKSRQSEVVNAEAQLYSVEADIESSKSQVEVARQLLEFLIGKPAENISYSEGTVPELKPENYYLAKLEGRPDVQASGESREVFKKNVSVAKSGFFPSVSFEGNLYTQRNTQPEDGRWDAGLTVDIPIFEGTETFGAVKLARAQERESQLQFSQTKRLAVQDIRDSYVQLKSAILRMNALKLALDASEQNYKLQKQDYELNLVNNLDVLQSIQTLENAKISYLQSLYDTKRQYWQLQVSIGESFPD
ncbi:MAG: TolC family protein [Candidatus Omnitrophica bacterium]|nr:TolC family protein [Candidatus Omnitrophota bacterium]